MTFWEEIVLHYIYKKCTSFLWTFVVLCEIQITIVISRVKRMNAREIQENFNLSKWNIVDNYILHIANSYYWEVWSSNGSQSYLASRAKVIVMEIIKAAVIDKNFIITLVVFLLAQSFNEGINKIVVNLLNLSEK